MTKYSPSLIDKYKRYITDIVLFGRYIVGVRKLSMLPLYLLGFVASTFHILAFMSCVKFVSGTMHDKGPIYGIPYEYIGLIFVFLVLLMWALGTKYYRVSLVDLEMSVTSDILGKILYRNLLASSGNDVFHPGLSNKLGSSSRSLFIVSLNMIVVTSVFSALFFINARLTLFLLVMLTLVSIFIPKVQARAKLHGKHFQDASALKKKALKDVRLQSSEFLRRDAEERVTLDISSVVGDESYWRHRMVAGVENSALLLNLFATVSITGMMFWYLNFEGPIDGNLIAELAIFLILLRFTVSYAGNLFRQLLQVNTNYRDISLLSSVINNQPQVLMPESDKEVGITDLPLEASGPEAVQEALVSMGHMGAVVYYPGLKQVVKLKVPMVDLQSEFHKSPLDKDDYSFESLPNTGRSKVQCDNLPAITDFAVVSTMVTGILLDSHCVVIPRDVYDQTSHATKAYVEHMAKRVRVCLTYVKK